jgi:hypothetical protein
VDERAPQAVDLGHHDALGVAALDASDRLKERAVAAGARLVELLEDVAEQIAAGPLTEPSRISNSDWSAVMPGRIIYCCVAFGGRLLVVRFASPPSPRLLQAPGLYVGVGVAGLLEVVGEPSIVHGFGEVARHLGFPRGDSRVRHPSDAGERGFRSGRADLEDLAGGESAREHAET